METIRVDGMAELEKALKDLRAEMSSRGKAGKEGNLVMNALRYAGRTSVMPRMVTNAPEDTGRLKRSIFYKPERNPRYLDEVFYVGPRLGKSRDDPKGAWYAAIVEFKGGKNGRGKGYMRNSIRPEEDARIIGRNLGAGIERVAKKIGNKNLAEVGAAAKRQFKP